MTFPCLPRGSSLSFIASLLCVFDDLWPRSPGLPDEDPLDPQR